MIRRVHPRILLPGFAFKHRDSIAFWEKLLTGRSAEIWLLSVSPSLWFAVMYWKSPIKWLKKALSRARAAGKRAAPLRSA